MSPAQKIFVHFKSVNVNGSARWLLDDIAFERYINQTSGEVSTTTKRISICLRNGSKPTEGAQLGNYSVFTLPSNKANIAYMVLNRDNYIGMYTGGGNQWSIDQGDWANSVEGQMCQFVHTICFQINNIVSNADPHLWNYNVPADETDLNRLVKLDWSREYTDSSTSVTENNVQNYCLNVFYTMPNGTASNGEAYYNNHDYATRRSNFLRNGNPNSDITFIKYCIDTIENNLSVGIDTYTIGELFKLEGKFCSDKEHMYIIRTGVAPIESNTQDYGIIFGNESTPANQDFSITETYFLQNGAVKSILKGTRDANDPSFTKITHYIEVLTPVSLN